MTAILSKKVNRPIIHKYTPDQYFADLRTFGQMIINDRCEENTFEITDDNRELYTNIFYWLTYNDKCQWSLNKGLYFFGSKGVGKSIALLIIKWILYKYTSIHVEFIQTKFMIDKITEHGLDYYNKRPVIFDDIAKEQMTVKIFGREIQPFPDMINKRYEHGALTLMTSNFKNDTIESKYGSVIFDRLISLCNFVKITGGSFRK